MAAHERLRLGNLVIAAAGVIWLMALATRLVILGGAALLAYGLGAALVWRCFARRETPVERSLARLARVNLLVLPIFVVIPGTDARILGYYGSVWVVATAAEAGETLIALILASRARFSAPKHMRLWLAVLGVGFLLAMIGTMLVAPRTQNLLAVTWLAGVFPALLWAAYASASPVEVSVPKRVWILAGAGLVALCVGVNLVSLRDFPNFMNTDEPWTLSFADSINRTGQLYASMFPDGPVPERSVPRIYYLLNLWMNVLGQRSIFTARAFSLLAGILLLPVIFAVGRALYDARTALVAVVLLAISILWMAVSHVARPDLWLTLAVWSGIALLAFARRRNAPLLAFIGGLALALSAETHLFGAVYCVIVGVWRLALVRNWREERMQILALIGGGGIGAAFFVSYHILPDVQSFTRGLSLEQPITGNVGNILDHLILRYQPYLEADPVEVILLVGGALCAVFVLRERARLGVLAGLCFFFYAVIVTDANMYYLMAWLPALILLTAYTIRSIQWPTQAVIAVLLIAIVSINVVRVRESLVAHWNEDALSALETVAAHIPNDGTVLGQPLLYIGLRAPNFVSYAYLQARYPDHIAAGLQALQPCYLVTNDQDWIFIDAPNTLSYGEVVDLPSADAPLYQTSYHVTDSVATEEGTFRIWRRNAGCAS